MDELYTEIYTLIKQETIQTKHNQDNFICNQKIIEKV